MLVVCDTGPLRYLIEIDAIQSLTQLYGEVMTPPTVMSELAFPRIRTEVGHLPADLAANRFPAINPLSRPARRR